MAFIILWRRLFEGSGLYTYFVDINDAYRLAARKVHAKGNISLKEVIMKFGAALVPVLVLSILWLVFAMLNIPYVTVILSVMMFVGLQLIAVVLFRSIQSERDAERGDLMYAGWVFYWLSLSLLRCSGA